MEIKPAFEFGQVVFIATDVEQLPCIVTGYVLRPKGNILYIINCNGEESEHYPFELSKEADFKLKERYKED